MNRKLAVTLLGLASIVQFARAEDDLHIESRKGNEERIEFEAIVLERLKSDGFWSGWRRSHQGVRYGITKFISGDPGGLEVTVYHELLDRSLCDDEAGEVVLSKEIFAVGKRLRLKAERTRKGVLIGVDRPISVPINKEEEERQPNQALQTTSVTRSRFDKVPVSDRQRRGV